MYELYLFGGMVLAASLSGLAIMLSISLAGYKVGFFEATGLFLAFRAAMFMSSKDSELTDSFVHYLSVERIKWAAATILVATFLISIKYFYNLLKRKNELNQVN